MKNIILLFALLLTATAHGQVVNGTTFLSKSHQHWESSLLLFPTVEDRIRMHTISANKHASIMIDRIVGDQCEKYLVQFVRHLPSPMEVEILTATFDGEFRVDGRDVIGTKLNISSKMGDKSMLFYFVSYEKALKLLMDMQTGSELRMKVELGSGRAPYFEKFSLNGFVPALQRTNYLCRFNQDFEANPSIGNP